MRRACKVDGNHGEITNGLREVFGSHISIESLAKVGDGCPDIAVGYKKRNFLFEIKVPGKKLNEVQALWHDSWRGIVYVVETLDDAIAIIRRSGA